MPAVIRDSARLGLFSFTPSPLFSSRSLYCADLISLSFHSYCTHRPQQYSETESYSSPIYHGLTRAASVYAFPSLFCLFGTHRVVLYLLSQHSFP